MGLVSKSIPNLINGVSQQPPALRLESQGEVQENGFSDVVDGLKKRPPTQFLKKLVKCDSWDSASPNLTSSNTTHLSTSDLNSCFFHSYKRSENEQYTVVILNSISNSPKILVYDIEGNLRYESDKASWDENGDWIENNSNNTDYLDSTSASEITATSVADATFIVNKTKTVALSDVKYPFKDHNDALVYLKSSNYGRNYKIKITSKEEGTASVATTASGTYTTPNQDNDTTINSSDLKISTILGGTGGTGGLRNNLAGNITGSAVNSDVSLQQTSESYSQDRYFSNVNLQTDAEGDPDPTRYFVWVAGQGFSYDATGVNGWKFNTNSTVNGIVLPTSVFTEDSNGDWISPHIIINELAATTDGLITPHSYGNEPFFIFTSTDGGNLKDFTIDVSDDDGGVNLKAFKGFAKSFTDLPNQCIEGFRLGVVGDNQKKEDDFHVVFEGGGGSGFWRESVAPNLYNKLDLNTMPHALIQKDNKAFQFTLGSDRDGNTWSDRLAGDDNTNPAPSFVGQQITDIFFHRNRLGVLAGENVIFSEAGGYLNFWRTTVRTLLDSDPIDVAVSQNEVSLLQAAVPIQDNLLLFSELNQFTLSAAQLLTPTEVTIEQSTKYECDLTSTPVGAGTSVFFTTKSGEYSGVREFFTKDDTAIKDAPSITSHVPEYIKGEVRKMVASSNEDMLVCLTLDVNDADSKKECYIYSWYNSSQERLQSSWSKWVFDRDIVDVYFNNADLYFTFADGSFEKMDLAPSLTAPLLDSYITVEENSTAGQPPVLPEDYLAGVNDNKWCVDKDGLSMGAYNNDILTTAQSDYLATSGNKLTVGSKYTFKYTLSEQVFKPVQGDSTDLSRFQLRKMSFNYNNTGHFDVLVESEGKEAKTSHFTGRILGDSHNEIGTSAIVDHGSFQVGVQAQASKTAITITNDTHLPCVFQSAEWEGFITLRNQRI